MQQISKTAPVHTDSPNKPKWEVADIFRQYGQDYLHHHSVPGTHQAVMHDILICRTKYLGGHLEQCDTCSRQRHAYNSCRNRHCPKCQALTKAKWLKARQAELLPVTYFHVVFTLPHEINPIAWYNKRLIFNILFKAASQTLLDFGKNPENRLGGKLGFTAILHTWDQLLNDHLHLHCVVPGGVLTSDQDRWVPVAGDYLFSVIAMSKVFQAKFIDLLQTAFDDGKLTFPGNTKPHSSLTGFKNLKNKLWAQKWVVYAKPPFDGPQKVLDYLGRYTHRVAISNHRIIDVSDGWVSFTYRDRKDNNQLKETSISANEFIRRFFLHVLPKKFMRIRHFGFLANCTKKVLIGKCRQLMGLPSQLPEAEAKTPRELMLELTGIDISQCPFCKKGTMKLVEKLPERPDVSLISLLN